MKEPERASSENGVKYRANGCESTQFDGIVRKKREIETGTKMVNQLRVTVPDPAPKAN